MSLTFEWDQKKARSNATKHLPAPVLESPFYVYAIECEDGSIYIGHCEKLLKRWREHCRGAGAEWTKRNRPVRIALYECASTREEAVAMEKDWKTGFGRKRIKRLIQR